MIYTFPLTVILRADILIVTAGRAFRRLFHLDNVFILFQDKLDTHMCESTISMKHSI